MTAVADLNPAYFALVMATGIMSVACHLLGPAWLARGLFALNVLFYAVLSVLTVARLVRHARRVVADLVDHKRGVGFFTTVAATCVLGSQCVLIGGAATAGTILWVVGIALWALLTYTIFTAFTVKQEKPGLAEGIHGGWLVAVVATQSVSVLGSQLAPAFGDRSRDVLFFALALWLGGGMLYIWIISLIFYRYTFFPLKPSDLSPPYWINMGAMAISTLAGVLLVERADGAPLLAALLPFLKGFSIFFWTTATWWIPMLVILGVWRHVVMRFPLRYDPLYWGAVFPLGMYTVATHKLAVVLEIAVLRPIPRVAIWIALAAWAATFAGLARRLVSRPRGIRWT